MNPDLQQLQAILRRLGYLLAPPSGELDEPTRAALCNFQRAHRLRVSGEADDLTRELADRAAAAGEYVVFGHVLDADGERPLRDAVVSVQDRDLGVPPWRELGQDRTDADGFFAVLFNLERFAAEDLVTTDADPIPDLLFSLDVGQAGVQSLRIWRMPGQDALSDDDIELGLQARRAEEVRIVARLRGRRHVAGVSEYEGLLAAFSKVWPDRSPGALDQDARREFSFVARELGVEVGKIEALANAYRWTEEVFGQRLGPEVLYALARGPRHLSSLQALGTASGEELKSGIVLSIEDGIIPFLEDDRVAAAVRLIRRAGPGLAKQPDVAGLPSFAERLGAGVVDVAAQTALLRTFADHHEDSETFWRQLRTKPEFSGAGAVERAQFALQLDALTQSHVPLMRALQGEYGLSSTRDLLRFGEQKLRDLLAREEIGIPVDVPGEDGKTRMERYVTSVMGALHLALPTETVAMSLREMPAEILGGPVIRSAVDRFFENATSAQARAAGRAFDIRETGLPAYVAEHGEAAFAGVGVEDRVWATQHIARAQRLFRVSADPKVFSSLMASGIGSARDIASMSCAAFTARFQESLGPGQAMLTYNNAVAASASTLQMYVTVNDLFRGLTPAAIVDGDPDGMRDVVSTYIPDWQEIFGSAQLCACAHCRSVYSAAAYLVDILHFLEGCAPNADGFTPLDILIGKTSGPASVMGRRPDLAHLKLTCENTETAVPYLDLVNEVLECLALSWATAMETDVGIVADKGAIEAHDTGIATVDELRSSPQFIVNDAYHTPDAAGARDRLDRAVWPLPLPYDAALDAVRGCLGYMGVPAESIMEIFDTSGDLARSRVETLRMAPREFAVLTGFNLDGTPAAALSSDELHGFTAELLPRLGIGDRGLYVRALKQKLNAQGAGLPLAPDPGAETFDAATASALSALQAAHGIDVNGAAGIKEWRILGEIEPEVSLELLPPAGELLRRLSLQFDDLVQLCEMRFLNPQGGIFAILQRLGLAQASLEAWIGGGLAGDPGTDIVAALALRGISPGEFKSWAEEHLQGGTWDQVKASLVLESPAEQDCDPERMRLRHWDAKQPTLAASEWQRLNRLVRLWRRLGWTLAELDRALTALEAKEITPELVSQLAFIQRLKQDLGLGVDELTMLWAAPDVVSPASFYAERFLSKAALRNDAVFSPDWKGQVLSGAKISEHIPALLSGLRLKAAYLDAIRAQVLAPGSDELSIESLGLMARHAILARALDLRPPDFITLLTLSGMNPFVAPGSRWELEEFAALARGAQNGKLSIAQLDYLFRGAEDHPLAPDPARRDQNLAVLDETLARLSAEYSLVDDPLGEQTRARLETIYADASLVNRFVRMIDGSAVYSTPLAAMPADVVWPSAHAHRFTFDTNRDLLIVRGALTASEGLMLGGLSADGDFIAAINALAAMPRKVLMDIAASPGAITLIIPSAEARLIDTSSFDADGGLDPVAVAAKFAHVLGSILPALQLAARHASVKQHLENALGVDPALISRLLETGTDGRTLLHAAGAPTEPMIADFLGPLIPANTRRSWLRLHKAVLIVDGLSLGETELAGLADVFDFDRLPDAEPTTYDPAVYAAYRDLVEYVRLRDGMPAGASRLATVFSAPDLGSAVASLAAASGLAEEGLRALVTPEALAMTQDTVQRVAGIGRLLRAGEILNRLGVAPAQALAWANQPITAQTADELRRALRAPLSESEWRGVAGQLNDVLREARRDALAAYLLPRLGCDSREQLYEQLLIDVDMGACMSTSRIKQAAASVQLFVQRCLMNLEPEVAPTAIDPRQWAWMKRYRVWEANRKVFLYPENWILPELRDDKTPFFKELEAALLQNDLTDANAERALLDYLEKLNEVAKLHLCGMFVQSDFDAGEKLIRVVHVFARTLNAPFAYYYRRYELDTSGVAVWTPWEHVPVDVRGDQVAPVVFNRRLYLFWSVIASRAQEPSGNAAKPAPVEKYDELQIAWSEYSNGKWSPKRISDPEDTLCLSLSGSRRLEARVTGEELSLVYLVADIHGISYLPGFTVGDTPMPGRTVQEYLEKAEGKFSFDNCHGSLRLRKSGWSASYVTGYGIDPWGVQPLGNGVVPAIPTLTRSIGGASVIEMHERHAGSDYFGYEDAGRVYFGHVEPTWSGRGNLKPYADGLLAMPELTKYREMLAAPYEVKDDLGKPYFLQLSRIAAVSSHAWMSAAATLGARQLKPGEPAPVISSSNLIMEEPLGQQSHFALISDYAKYLRTADAEVRYEIFYHPFTCEFMAGLRRHGIPGLLNLENQQLQLRDLFGDRYKPANAVVRPYPVEYVDFGRNGKSATYNVTAYSVYNWELFFHVPVMIAARLSAEQRFEDAMRWYHYVFNPTDGRGGYWKVLPFRTTPKETIGQLLADLNSGDAATVRQVALWREHPFQPHQIARARLIAYQKYVVMKYIDNLLAWGDQLFRQDTIETINEATQLYVMAATLLGPRPQQMAARGDTGPATFAQLRGRIDAFGNAMTLFENIFPYYAPSSATGAPDAVGLLGVGRSLYFCIPQNEQLLGYWDRVADRLFKIRHCMNIEGVVRQLPLFEPPIDPALLVRAAASGMDLGKVMGDLNAPAPFYRFTSLLQKALDLCTDLKNLGAQFLQALEKRDAEHLARLRQEHEGIVLASARLTREKQIDEARAALDALRTQRQSLVAKYQHFSMLLGADAGAVPNEGGDIPLFSARRKSSAYGGAHLIDEETGELDSSHSARDWQVRVATTEMLASALHYIPNFVVATAPFGVGTEIETGGRHLGPAMGAIARFQKNKGEIDAYDSANFRRMGEHARREQQWVLEANLAGQEIMHLDKQILGLDIRVAIAENELRTHEKQIESAAAAEEFLRTKFTNEELFAWMQGQTSDLFFRTYQLAYDLAKKAQRAFDFELGLAGSDFVQFGAWDGLRKGLLSGERLTLQLRQLDREWHERNRRELEITRHISLSQVDPQAFIRLKETGMCEFELPEALFDLDFPGHYFRRLRTVSISIPCVAGPYTSVSATLTLLSHKVRIDASATQAYPERPGEDETRFRRDFLPMQSVAISGGNNDSGVFELNLRDERYLPFEGAGAISRWRLQFPQYDPKDAAKRFAQFDFDSISDVVMHLRYTARDAGEALAELVRGSLAKSLNQMQGLRDMQGLFRLFSVRHEFPDAWFRFRESGEGLTLQFGKERLPYFVQGRKVTLEAAFLLEGADTASELAPPEVLAAQHLWSVRLTPAANAGDALVLIIYTIT
ncbi:hypothetical protein G3T20_10260 [Bordetella hinzii]|uniref:Tc toxin subunit A-related protein n=1 Tax=Bordetella hinzii TaxID=103855 RepID=UPI0013EFEBB7|nr:neuraminidase-like domain-containing protein [Bordetella hinzii]QII85021.1 hypothetical protein G3T20_10260 [Bordetella hinzii]